jgi:ribosome-associated protein
MKDFTIRKGDEFIKLGQLLKAEGLVDTGADAKFVIEEGQTSVNGEVCTMRGRKIKDGDEVSFRGETIRVHGS